MDAAKEMRIALNFPIACFLRHVSGTILLGILEVKNILLVF